MITSLFCLVFIALYSFLFIKRPKIALIFILLLLPTYLIRLHIFFLPTTFLELMIIGSTFGYLFKLIKDRTDIKFYSFLLPIFILLSIALFSAKISNETIPALGIFRAYFLEPIFLFVLFINNFKTKKDISIILNTLGVLTIYVSIYAIFQKITGIGIINPYWANEETRRVTSFFEYPNSIGLLIAPIVTIFITKTILDFKNIIKNNIFTKDNIFNFSVIILGLLSIFFAQSGGAMIGIFAAITFLIFIKSKNKLNVFLIYTIMFIGLFSLPITTKPLQKTLFLGDYSGQIRLQMWSETITMLSNNIIFGGGLNNFKDALIPYHNKTFFDLYLFPHNIILNFWSEIGLFGLITIIFIIFKFYKKIFIFRNKEPVYAIALSTGMVALLIHGFFDVPYFKNDLAILFWIIISIAVIIEKIDDNEVYLFDSNGSKKLLK